MSGAGRVENIASKRRVYDRLRKHLGLDFHSQATQDVFVLSMLESKASGYYLEIGAGHPFDSSNTFLLESKNGWRGLAIDIDQELISTWQKNREGTALCADATNIDYSAVLLENAAPHQIDYLSVDIEPATKSLSALRSLPFESFRFSVITFEHDRYRFGPDVAVASRRLLSSHGYELVVADVQCFGRAFEDWWVDPKIVREETAMKFAAEKIEFSSLWHFP